MPVTAVHKANGTYVLVPSASGGRAHEIPGVGILPPTAISAIVEREMMMLMMWRAIVGGGLIDKALPGVSIG